MTCVACVTRRPATPLPERSAADRGAGIESDLDRGLDPGSGVHQLSTPGGLDRAVGQAIVACGREFPIGAPVVLFSDPGGFDARRTAAHFDAVDAPDAPRDGQLRYAPGRQSRAGVTLVEPGSSDLEALCATVDQLVLHYDVCGTSARCFRVLQDLRGLSVHFMLDVDGTLYQCLDLRDQAWHAREANPRSIGIEIANIGARPLDDTGDLDRWSARDGSGLRLSIPPEWQERVRTPGFVARPARDQRVRGRVHGEEYEMLDLTAQQYDTLVALTAALCRIFPAIRPDAPRDAQGEVRMDALSMAEFEAFTGILGHHHVTRQKIDPGPAFRWEAYLDRVQALLPPPEPHHGGRLD